MEVSICKILSIQLALVFLFAIAVFVYTIYLEEKSIQECVNHGEDAVGVCFDQYIESIESVGESFISDIISLQLLNHVRDVVDFAEEKARSAATAVERTGFMDVMETNGWHGSQMLPSLSWMILGPMESHKPVEGDAVVADIVVATLNSTEEYNNWVWWGLAPRNPNKALNCDFYYYRNATNASSSLWCVDDLYNEPDQPSPSVYPHLYSPAIVKLQDATPCDVQFDENGTRPLVWMPLDFFVWTYNVVALTSVVGGIFGPDGTCQGFAAANVKFDSMSDYLTTLVNNARYENLDIALIESRSGVILGTSLGDAIYKVNQTRIDGEVVEQEVAASLAQMEDPLALALDHHIKETYGSADLIPTPIITSATLEGEEYFVSFQAFSRPSLNLVICALIPHVSITGPIGQQRLESQISYETSAQENADIRNDRLVLVIAIGAGALLACAIMASASSAYLSLRIRALVKYMDEISKKIAGLVGRNEDESADSRLSTTAALCEPLDEDFFPVFGSTKLRDVNIISSATEDLSFTLLETWNENQEVFRRALEQRQFTASIAHDIRNPLHGVLGIVCMMQNDIDTHKDKLPLLDDTLKHMGVLLNDMVDLSKIQGGKVPNVTKSFDAWNTVKEVLSLYRSNIVSNGGDLSCVCLEEGILPPAHSDPVHIQRILTNFVSNAAKYAGGSEITLKAIAATREQVKKRTFLRDLKTHFSDGAPFWSKNSTLDYNQYIVLACQDKGRGIPAEKLKNVFEAYQQTRNSDRFQGAGLGLAIVKGLAVELGGGAGVQSEEGKGSLFWIVVPSYHKALPSGKTVTQDKGLSIPSPPSTSFAGYRVLVIDDTKLNLMLLKNFLKRLDVECETCTSAKEGLDKLREDPNKFSLIISDFHMPEMDGGEMCLEMRKDDRLCHLPFICSSGNHLSRREKFGYKIDAALMKPFTIDQLRETLANYINHPSKFSPGDSSTSACEETDSETSSHGIYAA